MLSVYHIDISSNILRIIKDDSSSLPCPQFLLSKILIGIPLSFARHGIFPKMTVKINKLLSRASASDCQRAISQIRGSLAWCPIASNICIFRTCYVVQRYGRGPVAAGHVGDTGG